MTRTLALLESPAQILNLLEWAHHTAGSPPGEITAAVILPRARAARRQLRAMADIASGQGMRTLLYAPRAGARGLAVCAAALAVRTAGARRLLLGDPFSRLAQALLPVARAARDVTVVDDGTATIEFAAALTERRPLVRWHGTGPAPPRAVRAARWFTDRRPHLFTGLPVRPPAQVRVTANDYRWTLAEYGPPDVTDTVDLLGTSLAETGVVPPGAYLDRTAALIAERGVTRYLAHRREAPGKLAALAERTGVRIVRPSLPLELHARIGPVARTIISFPSTVLHTLPVMLAGTGARVVVQRVGAPWLAAAAGERARWFLAEVTASAMHRHGLDALPSTE